MERDNPKARASLLWLWIVAACLVHVAAWVGWFIIAGHHPVQEVPLATQTAR
jgi:hypothetical protein